MMTRMDVIQKIIKRTRAKTYLEIGVAGGECFLPIRSLWKIAVDPCFKIPRRRRRRWMRKNPFNWWARYHAMTSDDFFAGRRFFFGLDVVFVDGLHTQRQALKDVENALAHLNPGGVIVIHDCNPPSAAAAHPAESLAHAASLNLPGWNGEWCGDVWKSIVMIRSQRRDVKAFVLDCDFGLGIVTWGKQESTLDVTEKDIERLTYDDLVKNRKAWLDLKDENFFHDFLRTLRP